MNHFNISITKSIIRIAACVLAITKNSVLVLGLGMIAAEGLGVLEEIYDKREE